MRITDLWRSNTQRTTTGYTIEQHEDSAIELYEDAWPYTCTRCGNVFYSVEELSDPELHDSV